ncbi:MAG: hypothetical protein Q9194_000787 [Teloschistes cf. exilis]
MGIASALATLLPRSIGQALLLALGGFIAYSAALVIYRLFFHPLRKIPGPLLARATSWYEFYQDVILVGHYVKEYPNIHAKYEWDELSGSKGPVVRVSPDRVHVNDPEFFHEADTRVYASNSKYMKDPNFFSTSGGISEALPALVHPEYHRQRRKMVNNLFSARNIEELAPIVIDVIRRALAKATEAHDQSKPLDIQRLYTGVTIDTIMRVLCDKQLYLIEAEEEEPPFLATLRIFSENFFVLKHFPILTYLSSQMPQSWAEKLIPGDHQFRKQVTKWIEETAEAQKKGVYGAENGRKTVLDLLLNPEDGYAALSKQSIVDETYSFCFAGTHTTSFTISLATYYLLRSPDKLAKLREELKTVEDKRNPEGLLEYRDVYKLPYLTAIIKESLRLSSPVPGILPRVVPASGLTWAGYYLPPDRVEMDGYTAYQTFSVQTPVSIAIRTVHDNPKLFPEPEKFIPERWIETEDLDHWLVVFGKGSRSCIGLNVAWLELYLCLSNFFTRLDMSLYKTDEKSVEWDDCGNAMVHSHVKVTVDKIKDVKA